MAKRKKIVRIGVTFTLSLHLALSIWWWRSLIGTGECVLLAVSTTFQMANSFILLAPRKNTRTLAKAHPHCGSRWVQVGFALSSTCGPWWRPLCLGNGVTSPKFTPPDKISLTKQDSEISINYCTFYF